MRVPASLFLAFRYLRPQWSFVSLISFLSVLGPTLGVAVLIVVMAVMAGFGQDIRSRIFGMQAHITLQPALTDYIDSPDVYVKKLQEMGLKATATAQGPVLIQTRRQIIAKFIKGIDPRTDSDVTIIRESTTGTYDVSGEEAIVGSDLAFSLGIGIGDTLVVHSTGKLQSMVKFDEDDQIYFAESDEVYLPEELEVVGIFDLGMYDYDSNFILVHLEKANEIFNRPWESAGSIQVWTDDPDNLDPIVDQLFANSSFFAGLGMLTWQQVNRQLFGALKVEKNMQFFLLTIIVGVAAFSITGTLITIVVQKTREIGVLKAMGATPLTIQAIFMLQGAVVGLLGVLLGLGLGLLILTYRNHIAAFLGNVMGVEVFPAELYQLPQIPAHVDRLDVLAIAVSTFLICVLAAAIPALYAGAMTPSNALRVETG